MSLYSASIHLLPLAVKILSFFRTKERDLWIGQKEVFGNLEQKIDNNSKYIWFHAASLGEFEQGRPLMEKLKVDNPEFKIIVTFFSPSGYQVRKDWAGADIVCYLPFDTKSNVTRFLDIVKPTKVFFIKYELWCNYLYELRRRRIDTYIISAIFRPTQNLFNSIENEGRSSFSRMIWRTFGRWTGYNHNLLKCFTHIFIQDDDSARILDRAGIESYTVCGDTRFDRVVDIQRASKDLPLIGEFSHENRVMIAGSSWPKDEEIIINWFNNNSGVKLIIAPHEIGKDHIDDIISRLKRPHILLSEATKDNICKADCLIIDCFGLLSSIYRYAQIAYIGGGFGVGIHNVLEAAVYGMPVIWGPNYRKFREAKQLLDSQAGFTIDGEDSFNEVINRLTTDTDYLKYTSAKAGEYVSQNAGATTIIYNSIFDSRNT
ncbi:MAG: 3-deoxy-D-manno-octulosonic acid transferase [Bacteroidales bacterium]